MGIRRENGRDDDRRTKELLGAVDRAFDNDAGAAALEDERSFESVLLFGLANDKAAATYPPAGHGYPKRG
jgi:hypothetical protein